MFVAKVLLRTAKYFTLAAAPLAVFGWLCAEGIFGRAAQLYLQPAAGGLLYLLALPLSLVLYLDGGSFVENLFTFQQLLVAAGIAFLNLFLVMLCVCVVLKGVRKRVPTTKSEGRSALKRRKVRTLPNARSQGRKAEKAPDSAWRLS